MPKEKWANRTKVVVIWRSVKEELDAFILSNPEIKLTYFISDAILEKIQKEKLREQLNRMGQNTVTS